MKTHHLLYLCLFIGSSLMMGTAVTTLSKTSFLVPKKMKEVYARFVPQGWSFFTRNPREELLSVHLLEDNQYTTAFYNNGHSSNFFGASRKSRRLGYEFSSFMQSISKKEWIPYTGIDYQPLTSLPATHTVAMSDVVQNITPGKYLFVMQEAVPWAWSATFIKAFTKCRYIIIDVVDCTDHLANK